MKTLLMILTTFSIVSSTALAAEVKIVTNSRVPAETRIMKDYGNWNDVQITLSGILRNSCFSKEATKFAVKGQKIYVKNLVKQVTNVMCLQVLTPYEDAIYLRGLKNGIYDVFILDRFGKYQDVTSFEIK